LESVELIPTVCAICKTNNNATELYQANFEMQALNPEVFSARRLPDKIHYRMVKCDQCGLVRSDPVAPPEILTRLYRQSTFTYGEEVENLKQTYGHYLSFLTALGARKNSLLEIGCGNGFFLEEALRQGYKNVQGVEPSEATVQRASPDMRKKIICDVMQPGLVPHEQYDAVCMFQVLDHIPDPGSLIQECLKILIKGGFVLCLNHNINSWSARLFNESSPIIDIEHTYLYSPVTLARLFKENGFYVRRVGTAYNRCTILYLMRLLPWPVSIKTRIMKFLDGGSLGRIKMNVPLGNVFLVAQKR
jgi:SAM-dependent methyltransferase